jgi:uncharacterized integral membrane protein
MTKLSKNNKNYWLKIFVIFLIFLIFAIFIYSIHPKNRKLE